MKGKSHLDWRKHVRVAPGICHGKACITGTRVMVSVVLDNLASGMSPEEIVASYPTLKVEDLRAAKAYAAEIAHEHTGIIVLRPATRAKMQRLALLEKLLPRLATEPVLGRLGLVDERRVLFRGE